MAGHRLYTIRGLGEKGVYFLTLLTISFQIAVYSGFHFPKVTIVLCNALVQINDISRSYRVHKVSRIVTRITFFSASN
jgi:hypothetical protein